MLPNRETLLCRYHYDPLDRLIGCTPSAQVPTRSFYQKDRLATEIKGAVQRSIMQYDNQLLAQQQRQSGAMAARLLATDQKRSVLNVIDVAQPHPLAYSPYGHRPAESGLLSLLGFNGERPDPVTGCYLLGNGYRAFNPVLMRFNSPDSWSPFGKGGLNAYAYCVGDPVNRSDPNGHWSFLEGVRWLLSTARNLSNRLKPFRRITTSAPTVQNAVALSTGRVDVSIVSQADQVVQNSRAIPSRALVTPQSQTSVANIRPVRRTTAHRNPLTESAVLPSETDLYPHIGEAEWEDILLVFKHAPNEASQSYVLMMINEMRYIRSGQSTPDQAIAFLGQFVRD